MAAYVLPISAMIISIIGFCFANRRRNFEFALVCACCATGFFGYIAYLLVPLPFAVATTFVVLCSMIAIILLVSRDSELSFIDK